MLPGGLLSPQALYLGAMRHPFLPYPTMMPGGGTHLPADVTAFKHERLPALPLPGKPLDLSPDNRQSGSPLSPSMKQQLSDDEEHTERYLKSTSTDRVSDSISPRYTCRSESPVQKSLKFGITAILGADAEKDRQNKAGK